jgi:hypothetical protein
MIRPRAAVLPAVFAVALSACATRTEITHPPMDPAELLAADALIVQTDAARGARAPDKVVRGAGEGAATGMLYYMGGTLSAGGDGALLGLLLAPVGLPIAAIVGASSAHSAEEVDAARDAFTMLGNDTEFMATLEGRFLKALGGRTQDAWSCVAAISEVEGEPCPDAADPVELTLRPSFVTAASGRYSPDIHIAVTIEAVAHRVPRDGAPREVAGARWTTHSYLGEYFDLAANDAALMRSKLAELMDRFAQRIAFDMIRAPRAETVIRVDNPNGRWAYDVPEGQIARVEQGVGLVSPATHATLLASGSDSFAKCWITSVNGEPTGQSAETPPLGRKASVKAGVVTVAATCESTTLLEGITQREHQRTFDAQAGAAYRLDPETGNWVRLSTLRN